MSSIRSRILGALIASVALALLASLTVGMPTSNAAFNSNTTASAQVESLALGPLLATSTWWFDASDTATTFTDVGCTTPAVDPGQQVRCWVDTHNAANKVTSYSDTSYGEITGQTIGGRRAVHLPYTTDLRGPDLFGGQANDITIFIVANSLTATNNFLINLNGVRTGSDRFSVHLPFSNNNVYFDAGSCCDINRSYTTGVPYNTNILFVGWKDSAAGHSYHYVDRRAPKQSSGNSAGTTSYGLRVGFQSDHNVAEIIVFNRSLAPIERDGVANYLRLKWGLS